MDPMDSIGSIFYPNIQYGLNFSKCLTTRTCKFPSITSISTLLHNYTSGFPFESKNERLESSRQYWTTLPPLPPKYSMLKHFDVIQNLVPGKDHFNNKKHYKCKNAILKQKNSPFFKFSKTYVSETGCHGNMINHMDMVIIPKCS